MVGSLVGSEAASAVASIRSTQASPAAQEVDRSAARVSNESGSGASPPVSTERALLTHRKTTSRQTLVPKSSAMLRQKALPTLVRNASSLEQSKLETVTLASHLRPGQISGRSPMFWHWARLARAVRRLAKVS